jgi:hypothetical protein
MRMKRKCRALMTLHFFMLENLLPIYYFENLHNPRTPIRPVPGKRSDIGSGTVIPSVFEKTSTHSVTTRLCLSLRHERLNEFLPKSQTEGKNQHLGWVTNK